MLHKDKKTIAIIPARYASTRFPGKPLADIGGKTMIQRVYERVKQAKLVHDVWVATDDERIFSHVLAFGGQCMMTQKNHQSGTDRCAEVVEKLSFQGWVINVQGDEPFIQPTQIDLLVSTLQNHATAPIATLIKPIGQVKDLTNPNVVKVVIKSSGEAAYFSRQAIPYLRQVPIADWLDHGNWYKHLGLYGFASETLSAISRLRMGTLEKIESLEQLRWLEQGYTIMTAVTKEESHSVDTPEDLLEIVRKWHY